MKIAVTEYWRSRLLEGKAFWGDNKVAGYDYRGGNMPWPLRVAKDSLFRDYCDWCKEKGMGRPGEKSEFFRVLQPLIYIYGNRKHGSRHAVPQQLWHNGQGYQGRVQRYFFKLASLEVCRAFARLRWGQGDFESQARDKAIISEYGEVFDLTAQEAWDKLNSELAG